MFQTKKRLFWAFLTDSEYLKKKDTCIIEKHDGTKKMVKHLLNVCNKAFEQIFILTVTIHVYWSSYHTYVCIK